MRRISIRWRLTIFYVLTVVVISAVLVLAMFALMGTIFERNLRESVQDRAQEALLVLRRDDTISSQALTDLGRDHMQVLLLDGSGRILAQVNSGLKPGDTAPTDAWRRALIRGDGANRTGQGPDESQGPPFYAYALRVETSGQPIAVVQVMEYYRDSATAHDQPFVIATAIAGIIIVAIVIATVGSFLLIRFSLAPINDLATTAEEISAGDLSRRLPVASKRDELGKLAISFNDLLTRLEGAFAERERSLNEQRRFAADASHELRTPLTSILGYARMLKQWGMRDPEIARESIDALEREATRMQALVDQLLRLARGDEAILLTPGPQPIDAIVGDAVEAARATAGDKVTIAVHLPPTPLLAEVDRDRARQAIGILLDNAVKYSPSGARIAVTLQADRDMAVIDVADTGPGIAPRHLPHIFDRFYRVEEARTAHGAGLGLAIAKQIAEQHGGSIAVTSVVGEGSIFTLRFPLARSEDLPSTQGTADTDPSAPGRPES